MIELVFLLDRSGSMAGNESDVVGGVNSLIKQQLEAGVEAQVSIYRFDTVLESVCKYVPLHEAHLNSYDYHPRGGTALLDAVGNVVNNIGREFNNWAIKPNGVMFVIFTDGEENSSREFSKADISRLISRQEREWNWEFVYMGAHKEAFSEAQSIGIKLGSTRQFAKTAQGFRDSYWDVGTLTTAYAASVGSTSDNLKPIKSSNTEH